MAALLVDVSFGLLQCHLKILNYILIQNIDLSLTVCCHYSQFKNTVYVY